MECFRLFLVEKDMFICCAGDSCYANTPSSMSFAVELEEEVILSSLFMHTFASPYLLVLNCLNAPDFLMVEIRLGA